MKIPLKAATLAPSEYPAISTFEPEQSPEPNAESNNKNLNLMRELDYILTSLRTRKISLTALHAVISLSTNSNQKVSLSQLAYNLGITTAAVTNVADGMEKLGFAKRTVSRNDRRQTWMCLTPRGIAFAEWLEFRIFSGFSGAPS